MAALTDSDKAILDFAGHWYRLPGAHAEAIGADLGLSETTYWRKVNGLLERPEALAYDPVTVNRLRRMRRARLQARSIRLLKTA